MRHPFFLLTVIVALGATMSSADQITHRDGRVLEGKFSRIAKIAEDPQARPDPVASPQIFLVDDYLRRTMVPFRLLREDSLQPTPEAYRKIDIPQELANGRSSVACVGGILNEQDFDPFGRRIIEISTGSGREKIIQGITTITPVYTRVEGLKAGLNIAWDMRIATSSIPRDTLSKVVRRSVKNPKDYSQRVAIVELYMNSDRFQDALYELQEIKKDFPENDAIPKVLETVKKLSMQTFLEEIELRKLAGQNSLAYNLLLKAPTEGLPGTVLQQIRQSTEDLKTRAEQRLKIIEELKALVLLLPSETVRNDWQEIVDEIARDLTLNTLERLAPYWNFREDKSLETDQKLALAVSGWIGGADGALSNPKIALSLVKTRNLVRDYLREANKLAREGILSRITSEEANSPLLLTKLITHMKPVYPLPELPANSDLYSLEVPGQPGLANYTYQVVLPPEYDPYRSYPVIVCLHSAGRVTTQEIDWWAGTPTEKGRFGHTARYGYIVLAPNYSEPGKSSYGATPLEHDKVTKCLRDACRRFNIDSDRIFLSGHSMGGDAAWDMGLSHPDLWAGVIPINAISNNFNTNAYTNNAAVVPLYFVNGELDCSILKNNAAVWDRYYLKNYDVTLVQYLGRGHENFSDEILRLFSWMEKKNRFKDFRLQPKKFKVTTKRVTDNYFWAVELNEINSPSLAKSVEIEGEYKENFLRINAPGKVTIWISPDVMNFNKPMQIICNGKSLTEGKPVTPKVEVLLEDVRRRGERRHPFWAVLEGQ